MRGSSNPLEEIRQIEQTLPTILERAIKDIFHSIGPTQDAEAQHFKAIHQKTVKKLTSIIADAPADHFLSGSDEDENLQAMKNLTYHRMLCRAALNICYEQRKRQPLTARQLVIINHYIDTLTEQDKRIVNIAIRHGISILSQGTVEKTSRNYHKYYSAVQSLLAQKEQYKKQTPSSAKASVAELTASMPEVDPQQIDFAKLRKPEKTVQADIEATTAFDAYAPSQPSAAIQSLYETTTSSNERDPIIDTYLITTPASIQDLVQLITSESIYHQKASQPCRHWLNTQQTDQNINQV